MTHPSNVPGQPLPPTPPGPPPVFGQRPQAYGPPPQGWGPPPPYGPPTQVPPRQWQQAANPWGPPTAQAWTAPQAPRKSSGIGTLLLTSGIVIGVGVVAMSLIAGFTALRGGLPAPTTGLPSVTVAAPPTPVSTPTSASPEPTQTTASAEPSSTATVTQKKVTKKPTGVPAPNKKPPTVPWPRTYPQARQWLRSNALYNKSVARNTSCTMLKIDPYSTKSQLTKKINQVVACLWMVWNKPVTGAGFKLPRSAVTVYTAPITTPCGKVGTYNAYYCTAGQRIYWGIDMVWVVPEKSRTKYLVGSIVAHEFGHALQGRSGIMGSSVALADQAGKAEKLRYNRRLELQADCLAGMSIRSLTKYSYFSSSDRSSMANIFYSTGDDIVAGKSVGDHGQGKSRKSWFNKGLKSSKVSACRTYSASNKSVR